MNYLTKYITPDEFKQYTGIDLMQTLKDDDNPSNKANAFLFRIEVRMSAFFDANFYRNIDEEYPVFSDYQKEHYKYGLLEQALYVLKNGDISTDSGYEPDEGIKAKAEDLKKIIISPNAKDQFMLCGIWCRKIKNKARNSLDGWWVY